MKKIQQLQPQSMHLLFVLLLSLFLLSACQFTRGKTGIQQIQLHRGQEGLVFDFLPNVPPAMFYAPEKGEEVEFEIGITMMNKGASNIVGGYLALSLEKDYMQFKNWNLEDRPQFTQVDVAGQRVVFNLQGRSPLDPLGGQEIVTATAQPLPLDQQTEQHTTAILVTACYPYMTEAETQICIDTDVYGEKIAEKVCKVGDVSLSGGQGAPVAVAKIEQQMLSSTDTSGGKYVRPQFIIHVRNAARGTVVRTDKTDLACSSQAISAEDRQKFFNTVLLDDIRFSEFSLAGGHFDCMPKEIRLKNGEGFAKCTLKNGLLSTERESYATPLFIRLKYGYFQTIAKSVLLQRVVAP